MENVIEIYEKNLKKYPQKVIVRSAKHDEGLTYSQVEDISGRVYNFLRSKDIGTNDVVSLIVDRDVWFFPLMVGVMKAGATFVFIENVTPKDRIDYIIKDSGTKIVINDKDIEEICKYDYIDEYKIADLHDLCFILYTSGTTGNPKGILHEYGKWNVIDKTNAFLYLKKHKGKNIELYAMASPLSFAMSMFFIYILFFLNKSIYIISYEIVKNIKLMEKFLYEKQVSVTCLTPSYVKKLSSISPYLDTIIVGGETVSDLYIEGPKLLNMLSSSETLITVSCFEIDKLYKNCPLGKILNKKYIYLKDENGKEVNKGEIGEICVKNEYTRGYINLPNINKKTFIDGVFYSGDLAYLDENDNLIFVGRKDDMIKINGNRVEPLEIENKMMEVLKLKNVVIKAFFDNNRDYICAYLLKEELIEKEYYDINNNKIKDIEYINKILKNTLPQYMIPTYFIILDSYPRNENGKIQKAKLQPPNICEYKKEYKAPANEIEAKICDAFSEVLDVKNIGIVDDFFELGGDSTKVLQLLIALDNMWLNTKDIYENSTPQKLAIKYKEHNENYKNIDMENEILKKEKMPLMDEQVAILNVLSMDSNNTCFNIGAMIKLDTNVDIDKFEKAVNKVFSHHPVFNTSIYYDEYNKLVQGIRDNINRDVEVIYIKEKDFFSIKDNLIHPFVFNEYVNHRKKIFVTETHVYFFFDIIHTMADGYSIKLILKQIYDCYKNDNTLLETDYYYLFVKQYDTFMKSESANIAQEYYRKNYLDKYDFDIKMLGLTPDSLDFNLKLGYIEKKLDIKRSDLLKNKVFNMMGDNIFFMLCCILAMLRKDGKNTMAMQWLYDGRDSKIKLDTVGLFYKIMPIIESIKPDNTLLDVYEDIKKQIEFEIAYNNYSFNHNNNNILDVCLQFICQRNIKNIDFSNDLYSEVIEVKNKNAGSDGVIGFEVIDNDDVDDIICNIDYATSIYKKNTIEKFFSIYNDTVNKLCNMEDMSKILVVDIFDEIK